MPGPTGRGRPIATRWRIRSIWRVDARGQGIGGALLRRLIDDATAFGFRQMVAVIGDSANEASIWLHKAAGFELVGTLKDVGFKHGRWLDTVIMQRALGGGAESLPTR